MSETDPVLLSVMANRMDGIVREMTNTLLRAARSAVISSARDFSCCIVTGNDELLAPAEGLPVHIFGCHIQAANMRRYHAGDSRPRTGRPRDVAGRGRCGGQGLGGMSWLGASMMSSFCSVAAHLADAWALFMREGSLSA